MDWNSLRAARIALITHLAERQNGALGRTALMKFCYLLQTVRQVPLGYHFTLYSYGPFDSDVLSDLGSAENVGAVKSDVIYYPGGYGYQISTAENATVEIAAGRDFLERHRHAIEWVLKEFGSLSSSELELQTTLIYADRESGARKQSMTLADLASLVHDVKPRFTVQQIAERADGLLKRDLLEHVRQAAA